MAFATTADVEIRLGRSLTLAEEAFAEQTIEAVVGQIVDAVDRDAAWATDLDPVPAVLKSLCVEKVIAVGANPSGLAGESEQLGTWQHSKTFQRADGPGVFLTDAEERRARAAVYGATAGSSRVLSSIDDHLDLADDGEINDSVGS